jgi:ELWxxDGT repeat protein
MQGSHMPLASSRSSRGRRLGFEALEERQLLAITVASLGDLNTAGASSPQEFVALGNTVYFMATDGTHGAELWMTDGTAAGTALVKDINPGTGNSNPSGLTIYNDQIFFAANDGTSGVELWTSDGSAAGTVQVKDIWSGTSGSTPTNLVVSGSKLYFAAQTASEGKELWATDGSAAGTAIVKDITSGTAGSDPSSLCDMDGTLYFAASTAAAGKELWKSTGTSAGTVQVKDIWSGSNPSGPDELTAINGTLYFKADDGTHGQELWRSNGSAAGTAMVKDIHTLSEVGSSPYDLTNVNGTLYFQADDGADSGVGQYGNELWKSDGTASGTTVVKDIYAGANSSLPFFLTNCNGTLYFQAEDADHGVELWKSDGTASGTSLVKDIFPGADMEPILEWGDPSEFAALGGYVFFSAQDASGGYELWRTSGTEASTVRVKDIRVGTAGSIPLNLTALAGKLFFSADDGTTGREPYALSVSNLAPTDITLSSTSVAENKAIGSVVGTLSTTDPDPDNTFTYALVAGDGSTDNAKFTVSGNQLLTAAAFNYEAKTSYAIRLHSTDQDGLGVDKTFTITVTNVDEPPTNIALSATSMAEQKAIGTVVGTFSAVDPEGLTTFTYSLVSGTGSTDNAKFSISGNQLKNAAVLDYETQPSYSIRVQAADAGNNAAAQVFTITLTNVNDAPTGIGLSSTSVDEHKGAGTVVGVFSTTDPDADTSFTYALVDGQGSTGNSWFTLNGNQLKTTGVFNYESTPSYSIRVRSTDAGGLSYEQVMTIQVNNVNETPTAVSISSTSITEAQAAGTAVGTLSTTDPDAGNTFTYSLVSGSGSADNASFRISGSSLVTAGVLDYESRSTYSVRIRSADQGGLYTEKSFVITCNNVNEAPTDISLAPNSVQEQEPVGTVIGAFGTVDPDLNDTYTYTLVSGAGSTDNARFTISGNQLTNASLLNYDDQASYSIRVRTTDGAGASYEKAFTIYLTESPVTTTATTIGLYEPSSSWFSLRDSNTTGTASYLFGYGEAGGGWITLVGDWDGDGYEGVGLYNPAASTFYLTSSYSTGYAEYTFGYGEPGGGWTPLVGDWDGDGTTGVGLYDPKSSTFYLTNNLTSGYAQYTFGYGEPGGGWTPLVGDWDGNGSTGVGLFNPNASTFYLTNNLASGYAQHTFGYGEPGGGWTPLVGDWDGNGTAGVGLFNPNASTFYLTNQFVSGYAQYTFGYGEPGAGWTPQVGDWDASGSDGVGLYAPSSSTFYLTNNLTGGYADYTVGFGQAGHTYKAIVGSWTPKSTSSLASIDSTDNAVASSLSPKAVDQIDLADLVEQELTATL